MFKFKNIDSGLVETALKVLSRHGWYLTEEVVVFSLFSSKLTNNEKSRMAARFLSISAPKEYPMGPPKFPSVNETTGLVDLIGPNSWLLFNKLKVSHSWIEKDVKMWSEDPTFNVVEKFVCTVKTINDTAERGIKLMSDYALILTKDDQPFVIQLY